MIRVIVIMLLMIGAIHILDIAFGGFGSEPSRSAKKEPPRGAVSYCMNSECTRVYKIVQFELPNGTRCIKPYYGPGLTCDWKGNENANLFPKVSEDR